MTDEEEMIDDRYRDASLPIDIRVEILLAQMTVEEKAGLFFQPMIKPGPDGELAGPDEVFDILGTEELVIGRQLRHFNLLGEITDARATAEWHNRLQRLAASTRLGIPVSLSTDPRHAFTHNPGTAASAGLFSQWPEALGFGAVGDAQLVERFGEVVRAEYTAVGLRVDLGPQVDLATEPRWSRQSGTFGENAELSGELGAAYIRGLQGPSLGATSVAAMVKHFPGGGPQKDGEDPHFAHGREQVYPGGNFEYHLKPFEAVFAAGVSQVMPYYGMPIGTEYEEVGFGFNRSVITGLLRERYGFDGIVCTDWGLLSDASILGDPFPARAWGVEHLSVPERMSKALDAGVDQFGGESISPVLVELVRSGQVSEERLDVSVRRLLREKFVLGLFDSPYVDAEAATRMVGTPEFRAEGDAAQRAAMTVLSNTVSGDTATLPLSKGRRIYVENIQPDVAEGYGTVVGDPSDADVAIVRVSAPYERRGTGFESFFHSGSLDFPDETISHITTLAATVPTVLNVYLDRPAILTPFTDAVAAITADFGASDAAVLDVLFGDAAPRGRLPFELPSSMAAVKANRPDVPSDTADPLFRTGHGLRL